MSKVLHLVRETHDVVRSDVGRAQVVDETVGGRRAWLWCGGCGGPNTRDCPIVTCTGHKDAPR